LAQAVRLKAQSQAQVAAELSGGNQQKVLFARALAGPPVVLLLDEPTRGVDVGAKFDIYGTIRGLTAQGVGVVMVSSDLPELIGLSDRIGILQGGRLTQILPAEGLTEGALLAHCMEGFQEVYGSKSGGEAAGGQGGASAMREGLQLPSSCLHVSVSRPFALREHFVAPLRERLQRGLFLLVVFSVTSGLAEGVRKEGRRNSLEGRYGRVRGGEHSNAASRRVHARRWERFTLCSSYAPNHPLSNIDRRPFSMKARQRRRGMPRVTHGTRCGPGWSCRL
jgi:energy-coupling factor transporter ATP-binding protein EcfA2